MHRPARYEGTRRTDKLCTSVSAASMCIVATPDDAAAEVMPPRETSTCTLSTCGGDVARLNGDGIPDLEANRVFQSIPARAQGS